ncbi:flavin monoamine oxidase family protein [Nocardia asteroides]|uniref:flavin monoamine oxidase family protein n=1 Tax=Nocardia asteroides TaxID=1824 RepID=UPI0033EF9954
MIDSRMVDAVVIGAGLSGLTAAWRLRQAGRSVIVAEASARPGGRLLNSEPVLDTVLEMGGAWVGPGQNAVIALADELGVNRYRSQVHRSGDVLWWVGGRKVRFDGVEPPLDDTARACYRNTVAEMDALSRTVSPERPWDCGDAAELDGISLAQWLERKVADPAIIEYLGLRFTSMLAAPPPAVSMLYALQFLAACGGFERSRKGASERFEGGSQSLALRLAERLGDNVVFDSPVRAVRTSALGVRIETSDGEVSARKAIIACSPHNAGRIDFEPRLPARRQLLHDRLPMAGCIKMHAVYHTPFWREEGLNGAVVSDRPGTRVIYDHTPGTGAPGVLTTMMVHQTPHQFGSPAENFESPDLRAARYIRDLKDCFGSAAANPIVVLQQDWLSEQWVGGCESPFPPALLTLVGDSVRTPVGNIHWAGTETATSWIGFMDGAVQAGERVATEVAAALSAATSQSSAPGSCPAALPGSRTQ